MNKEIEIPEGHEARIEGNKVILERKESEDERIRKALVKTFEKKLEIGFEWTEFGIPNRSVLDWLEKQKELPTNEEMLRTLRVEYEKGVADTIAKYEKKEQKSINMEVYEAGKGTTICGQDYKCKKGYRDGNCWYIKDVIYHCGRDGYLTDQNGISWSCTPGWFKEYIYSNAEWAEKEKSEFVSGQFIQCNCTLDNGLKEGAHYWLEYIGGDTYVGRSDNILNQKFHITPRQLFTLFSQELEEKQKEQKPVEWSEEEAKKAAENYANEFPGMTHENDGSTIEDYDKPYNDFMAGVLWAKHQYQPKQEWSEEDELMQNEIVTRIEYCARYENELSKAYSQQEINWLKSLPERFALQPEQERQIKEGDKVSIHCRKDRKNTFFYDGKVGEVIHVWDAERNPWGHIVVRLDNGCNDGFHEDELEVLDEPTNRCLDAYKECTPISSGWVARDKNNDLHYFDVKKPTRLETTWHDRDYMSIWIDSSEFSELRWEDDPIKVELLVNKI